MTHLPMSGKVQVAVDVSSVIRASADSFRVAWIERRYQDGSLAATSNAGRRSSPSSCSRPHPRRAAQESARRLRAIHQLVEGAVAMNCIPAASAAVPR
ncbi:MAG: hypothetical protein LKM31_10580 [Sphingobium sp.]|jgi:hypothetical protein|nr:hypothetical protein [Sphingobium sp.]